MLRFLVGDPSEGALRRQVVRLTLPAVGEQVLTLMVGTVHTMLVGHLSAEALTSVGLSSTITGMAHILASAVGTGTSGLATRTMEQAVALATRAPTWWPGVGRRA